MVFARVFSTLWKMLNAPRRAKFLVLSLLLFVAGLTELMGMLALFGFIQGLSVNAHGMRHGRMARILQHFSHGPLGPVEYALWGGALLIAVILLKNMLSTLVKTLLNRFLTGLNHRISTGLFEGYMRAPYERLKSGHFGSPADNVGESFEVFSSCFAATAQILADGALLTMIIFLLVMVDPWLTLGCFVLFVLVGTVLYRFMEVALIRIGRAEVYARMTAKTHLKDGLRGILEARLADAAGVFVDGYGYSLKRTTVLRRRQDAFKRLPRSSNELLLALVIVVAVFYVTVSGSSVHDALPTLGLFGFAGLKFTSAMSRINSSLQGLRQRAEQFDVGYQAVLQVAPHIFRGSDMQPENDYLAEEEPLPDGVDGRLHHQLELEHVSFRYEQDEPDAIKDVTLRIPRGSFTSFCGSSGGGKSTLLLLMMGLMKPRCGTIECDGRSIFKFIRAWHKNIGYVGQQVFITSGSVRENVAFGIPKPNINDKKVWRALEQAAAADFVRQLPRGLREPLKEGARLSGGQRQRISIARALYHNPEIIVFDEATAALDNATESEITEALARLTGTKTIICVAHRLSTIRGSDVIHVVEGGTIKASGTYDELLATSPDFRRMAHATALRKHGQLEPVPNTGSS